MYHTCLRGQGTLQPVLLAEPAFQLWIKGEHGYSKSRGKPHMMRYNRKTLKLQDAKSNTLYQGIWDTPASPALTTTSQRAKHCLICFRDFLLTSSSGHLLSFCLKTFAWGPISSSWVPESSQVPSLKHCSPSHWCWPPSPLEGAVIRDRHFEEQIQYPGEGLESRLYSPCLLISFFLNGKHRCLIFPGLMGNQEGLWML